MSIVRNKIALTILALGFLLGVLFTSRMTIPLWGTTGCAHAKDSVVTTPSPIPKDFDRFPDVVEEIMPTVIAVYSEQTIRVRRPSFGFDDEFFRRFFGDFYAPQQPQYDEYRREGLGSGVIVSENGYILTNNHVITEADDIKVVANGKNYEAKLVGGDKKTDIAILKIEPEEPLKPAKLGDSDKVRIGQWVLAIGHPFNLDHTVTAGIISAKGRSRIGITDYEDFLQTDAAINPGNSGGALVNLSGEVIGINTAIVSRTGSYSGVGFAIPINLAKAVMAQLIEHGRVVRGWLGISIQDIDPNIMEAMGIDKETKGAIVSQVLPDSPAEKAGISQGDVITAIDGKKITNSSELRNTIATTPPGTRITLSVIRNGSQREIKATLGELPGEEAFASAPSAKEQAGDLGIKVAPASREQLARYGYNKGLLVTEVISNSPAEKAGVLKGDLVFEVNRLAVGTAIEFRNQVQKTQSGKPVLLLIGRNGNVIYLAVKRK